jgi:hypothetical protein
VRRRRQVVRNRLVLERAMRYQADDDSLIGSLKEFSKRVPVLDGAPLPFLDRESVAVSDTLSITGV